MINPICITCGTQLADDANFCAKCGTPAAVETPKMTGITLEGVTELSDDQNKQFEEAFKKLDSAFNNKSGTTAAPPNKAGTS